MVLKLHSIEKEASDHDLTTIYTFLSYFWSFVYLFSIIISTKRSYQKASQIVVRWWSDGGKVVERWWREGREKVE